MLKRKHPQARFLIIEKTAEFFRKVGESTSEVSSCYTTRILGLTSYLGYEQLAKQGLRYWFCDQPDQRFDACVEVGPRYQARVPTFQVDSEARRTHRRSDGSLVSSAGRKCAAKLATMVRIQPRLVSKVGL